MPATSNKGYEIQTTGSNAGTWGDVLNDSMISYADLNIGGTTAVALSSTPVTLSATQSRNAIIRFTGTLSANVVVTTACLGFQIFDNRTTGSFTVTIQYTGGPGATAVVDQSAASLVCLDATNGARLVAVYPDLAAIEALTGTGILKRTGTNTWSLSSGVTDLAATTANRLFGTDGSGVSGLITTGAGVSVAAGVVNTVASSKAEMESQSATAAVYPSVQKYHPGHPKAVLLYNMATETIGYNFGVTSVTRDSTGLMTVTWAVAFASTSYGAGGFARGVSAGSEGGVTASSTSTKTTSAMQFRITDYGGNLIDSTEVTIWAYGAQ